MMKLTEDEKKYSRRLIQRIEQDNKLWPWLRWLLLFVSILIMGSAIYSFLIMQKVQTTMASVLSMPIKEYDTGLIKNIIEGNMAMLRLEIAVMRKGAFQEILGLILFIYCLVNWNRHIKRAIMIKIMRQFTLEEKQED